MKISYKITEKEKLSKKKLEKIDESQLKELRSILSANGIEEQTVLKLYGGKSLEDITNQKYDNILSHIEDI